MKKVIVISGGSDGLGKTIAKRLSSKNTVIILSPTKQKLEKAAKEIGCEFEVCDVSEYSQVEKAIEAIIKKHKRIDCVINNAGLWIQGELDENNPDDIKKVIEVNTTGVIFLSKAVIPQMKKQKNGLIINIDSYAGLVAKAERTVYNASKWAITGFSKSLQPELAKFNIGVTCIYPGMMVTQMFEKMGIHKVMEKGVKTDEVAKTIEFILTFDNPVLFPDIGIKHIEN